MTMNRSEGTDLTQKLNRFAALCANVDGVRLFQLVQGLPDGTVAFLDRTMSSEGWIEWPSFCFVRDLLLGAGLPDPASHPSQFQQFGATGAHSPR